MVMELPSAFSDYNRGNSWSPKMRVTYVSGYIPDFFYHCTRLRRHIMFMNVPVYFDRSVNSGYGGDASQNQIEILHRISFNFTILTYAQLLFHAKVQPTGLTLTSETESVCFYVPGITMPKIQILPLTQTYLIPVYMARTRHYLYGIGLELHQYRTDAINDFGGVSTAETLGYGYIEPGNFHFPKSYRLFTRTSPFTNKHRIAVSPSGHFIGIGIAASLGQLDLPTYTSQFMYHLDMYPNSDVLVDSIEDRTHETLWHTYYDIFAAILTLQRLQTLGVPILDEVILFISNQLETMYSKHSGLPGFI
jgi:hypothetical protein